MVGTLKKKHACFLACIAGFLEENGSTKSQDDILSDLCAAGLCNDHGIVPLGKEADACNALGITLAEINYRYPQQGEFEDGSLMITLNGQQLHCLRFHKRISDEIVEVMNPDTGRLECWERSLIEAESPKLFQIRIKSPQDI